MKKKKEKFELKGFELLSENGNGTLLGGFSGTVESGNVGLILFRNSNCPTSNNCNGGNCVKGCGGNSN